MAIQVSYPGVYIEEFAPGAPIEGVGTNVAAFIGTATKGPIGKPTLIQSWDAFEEKFGGFIAEPPYGGYLAPAVYGFFLNGGTTCYVLRHGTGEMAVAELEETSGTDVLIVRARQEGPAGNAISVTVEHSSRLANLLLAAGSGESTLALAHATTTISAISEDDRRVLTVAVGGDADFAAGDRVLMTTTDASTTERATIEAIVGDNTIRLVAPVRDTFDPTDGSLRIADLATGQRTLRLTVPDGLRLNQALPRGASVAISLGGTPEVRTVESSGGDAITLTEGLTDTYDMSDPDTLPQVASREFNLLVTHPEGSETFSELSMNPHHPHYWGTRVVSEWVTLEEPSPPPVADDLRPAAGSTDLAGGMEDDRAAAWTDIIGDPTEYLDLLKPYDDVALVCIPGATTAGAQRAMIAHCETMYDRFAILDSEPGVEPGNGIRDQLAAVQHEKGFAALYYPWMLARNPLTKRDELWPPSGHITGVYARTDATRGVHKAPANTNLRGALGLERMLTEVEQGPLNLMGINVLRVFGGRGQPMVWGARTVASDRNWQYVNIRRLFLFLEESIAEGIRWAVFEPNNLQLWQKLKQSITEFLTRVWRDGALFGATADEAFYVRIDEALNPESTRRLGRLNIEVGVRPAYPAEFIVVRIGIWSGGAEVSES